MNCQLIEKKLIFYIDSELDAKESSLVKAHLEECPNCKYLYTQLRESLSILKEDKLTETNPFFATRVLGKIKDQAKRNPLLDWMQKKQFVLQFSIYILLIFFALIAGSYLGSGIVPSDQTLMENNSDTTDYQLFANSYNYNFNKNVYLVEFETNEE